MAFRGFMAFCLGVTCLVVPSQVASAALILHYEINATDVVGGAVEDISPTQENDAARSGGGVFALEANRSGEANEAVTVLEGNGIAVSNANGIATGNDFTIAGWWKGTDIGFFFDQESTRFVVIVEENTDIDPNDGGAPSGLAIYFDGTYYNTGYTDFNDDAWHHLAVVLDGDDISSDFSVYVDGSAIDVDPGTPGTQTTRTIAGDVELLQQGASYRQRFGDRYNANPTASSLAGAYDDLRIYDTALSAGEILRFVIPEPSSVLLLMLGGGAWMRHRRGRNRRPSC